MAPAPHPLSDAFGQYADVLDSERIAQFLGTQSWTMQSDLGYAQVWTEPGAAGASVARILLPIDRALDDYSKRLEQAVDRIGGVFDWRLPDLVEQIVASRADLFFVRVDQHMMDGTIPLRQASMLLENIDDMVRSAALTANNAGSTGKGRVPSVVNDFLNDDVRMGHTKHGSFIITVTARLDEPLEVLDRAEQPPSFTRQVMTTLARSLEMTKQVAEASAYAPGIGEAMEAGMRLPLVRALRSMGSGEGLQSLDLSFKWAPTERVQVAVPDRVEMSREVLELLPAVEARLAVREEPQMVTLTGPVVELKRSEEPGQEEDFGDVVVRADVDGKWRRVSVSLSGAEHQVAIVAYQQKLPFTVSGLLEKVGRSWSLTDDVRVDRTYIDFHQAQQAMGPVSDEGVESQETETSESAGDPPALPA